MSEIKMSNCKIDELCNAIFEPMRSVGLKREALNYFVEEILSKAKENIIKLIVFGSLTKGSAIKESDIDVFIVFYEEEERLLDVVCDISFESALLYGESIEPFLMSIYEFNARKDYSLFIREVIKYGKVIYEMPENEAYWLEAQGYVDLAEDFLIYAKRALEQKYLRPAIDEGYNAIELVIKALILIKGDTLSRSHGGIIQQFGRLYIVNRELEREIGKKVIKELNMRNKA
ncbi:MAG: nucleotidyltransferase domain-containing protein, partial [Methanosarcinales archaeon]